MSPRPINSTGKRPLSAVYLGKDPQYISSPPNLPDLPEPPSPVASTSSKGSGLPSPPATNSTGSGSTGDPASIARRTRPHPGAMLTELNVKTFHHAFEEEQDGSAGRPVDPDDDDDYDNDHDNNDDEDNTARLSRRQSSISSSENVQALERVKSLTQRNRMALDKLSSYSRLSTPSPKPRHPTTPKHHAPPLASTSSQSSSSSSRTRSSRHSHQVTPDHQSGSETEREFLHPPVFSTNSHSSSSHTSSRTGSSDPRPSTPRSRQRLVSAPSSPGQDLLASKSNSSHSSNSPSHIRKRASVALTEATSFRTRSPDRGVTQSALAAVASSRRSPTVGLGKKRQPLPPEFRDSPGGGGSTSQRNGVNDTLTRSSTLHFSSLPKTPARSSTVRDLNRRHQTRWMSEDLSATSPTDDNDVPVIGRRQTPRGGSAESALTVGAKGRSLAGEGLRAAGIGLKDGEEKRGSDIRTRAGTIVGPRAATSMAEYGRDFEDDDDRPSSASRQLRSHRSAYPLRDRDTSASRRDVERSQSSLSAYSGQERYSSPRISGIQQSGHHKELMHNSLSMFESQINRVQLNASNDLLRNAQGIVTAAERLQGLMKGGNGRALEEQINAEVGDRDMDADLVEIWRKVGGEYREGMRASDELVRAVTGLLLGVGKAVRDLSGVGDSHSRSISLDEDGLTGRLSRLHLTPETPVNGSGRRSADSRHNWDIRDREREEASRRLNARAESVLAVRPPSALNTLKNEDYPRSVFDTPSPREPHRSATTNGVSSGSMRRVQPREPSNRVGANGIATLDSQETLRAFDPSPTPASRINRVPDRTQTLPPLDIPRPLPTLPSESLRARLSVTPTPPSEKQSQDRNRDQQNQTLSRRKNLNSIFSVRSPNTTTALTTHTVSNSPDRLSFLGASPMQRTNSNKSNRSSVTFSRPSTISVSTLNGLQQQDERQRKSSSSGSVNADEAEIVASVHSPMSGSETERDWRRAVNRSARMSLDGTDAAHAADRSAASSILPGLKRERRRTVVDIWPPAGR
ncbi:hypothetical protein ARMSODRAFT_1000886 [Armillaria solidipes]|uniref:Uncharacterized protein n=1 Tax=Armillaria solidipes TaxID=1076256 RepID=A0A2H3CGI3_9AGAR|nr:hypothetical protein ARMSODRAFT_1000886 [Armillaria solidipes]